ncbi:uncharacterized mitochondrial protein-like protein [Tanacetum coccineum]
MIFMNEEKYTPPKSESNTDEDDVWYFDNGASNHMIENGTNQVVEKEANPHSSLVTDYETSPESEEDHSRSDDTPISIARLETTKLLIALAAGKGWKIHQLEVKTAFINGDRKKLDTDLFMTGASLDLINEFKRRMASQFEMSDPGELTYYLGIEVSQGNDCIEIKQERYTMKILKEPGMEDCNPALCPMEPRLKLTLPDSRNVTSLRLPPRCLSRLLCFQLHIVMFGYIDVDVTIFLHSK